MAENQKIPPPPPPAQLDLNAKWDACIDLGIRRSFYSSLSGAFTALLFFRTPAARWASVAFGAGLGIGSAYTECSIKFDMGPSKKPVIGTGILEQFLRSHSLPYQREPRICG